MLLGEIVGLLDSWYDPRWAEPWDRVGLVCGDPAQEVRRVMFAVDPVAAVVEAWRGTLPSLLGHGTTQG